MKKVLVLLVFVLSIFNVLAHGEESFAEAEEIIGSKIPCSQLNENQLELMGDYYMEQMHPGEQHEIMDEMMGGEGSESLREAHINMAKSFYCGEHGVMSANMMNMMMGRSNIGMMDLGGSNMMNWAYGGFGMNFFGFLIPLLVTVVLILLIFWLIRQISKKK